MDDELNPTSKNKMESKSKTDQPVDETFSQMLIRFMQERNITLQQLYNDAGISRKIYYRMKPRVGYKPKKYTVVRLALALKLSLDDTERLLKSAGYELSRSILKDLVISYCIANNKYSVREVSELLEDFGLPEL